MAAWLTALRGPAPADFHARRVQAITTARLPQDGWAPWPQDGCAPGCAPDLCNHYIRTNTGNPS
jgi:hypothetical protein